MDGPRRSNFLDVAALGYMLLNCTRLLKQSVRDQALIGDGRARQMLAHELGHAVMHDGVPMSRRTGASGIGSPKWLKAFESAEHQAKVFAPAFLINDTIAGRASSPDDISVESGISLESANIYFEELTEHRNHEKSAAAVLRMADELRALTKPALPKTHYLNEICTTAASLPSFR